MAALQIHSLVDGVYTARTVDINDVLRHQREQDEKNQATLDQQQVGPPVYGLLTRTVINSPVVNWILPARIRHIDKNDVVFIGDNLLQLRELHADGYFRDIASKSDFGSRIRSAIVIGEVPPSDASPSEDSEIHDSEMIDAPVADSRDSSGQTGGFPPQYIVLVLESGDLVFLYAKESDSGFRFVTGRHTVPESMLSVQPGAHLTVDPSSRFMALSCYRALFAIYQLSSKDELNQQYDEGRNFNPIKHERYAPIKGVIHKMEFLYPTEVEKYPGLTILLMLAVDGGKTKMFVSCWDTEDPSFSLQNISFPTKGHRVIDEAALPILLIPLRIKSCILLVTEHGVFMYHGVVEGAPCDVEIDAYTPQETSPHHHGIRPPMFTAWARPRRLKTWADTHDYIYIAREDGRICQLEIDLENDIAGVGPVPSIVDAGAVLCNIGQAFAVVDHADQAARKDDHTAMSTKMADILVMGGAMSNGMTTEVQARQPPKYKESIANWSPTADFVVIPTSTGANMSEGDSRNSKASDSNGEAANGHTNNGSTEQTTIHSDRFSWPDRVFACSGRGTNGAIAELRHGLEARIELSLDHQHDQNGLISQSWVLPDRIDDGLFFIFSSSHDSALLHLSSDNTNCAEIHQDATWLDLSCPTILAEQIGEFILQVTEVGVRLSNLSPKLQSSDSGWHVGETGKTNVEAAVLNDTLFLTTRVGLGSRTEMAMLRIHLDSEPRTTQRFETVVLDSEPTCLVLTEIQGQLIGIYALASKPGYIYTLDMAGSIREVALCPDTLQYQNPEIPEDVCHSMAVIQDGYYQVLLCGFRDGSFRTYLLASPDKKPPHYSDFILFQRDSTQVGTTAVTVSVDPLDSETAFIRCDSAVYRFVFDKTQDKTEEGYPSISSLHQIWFTDTNDPTSGQPFVNSITRFSHPGYRDDGNLLITSDKKLILPSLDPKPKAVPRTMPIGATPTAMVYSEDMNALVVAVILPPKTPKAGRRPGIDEPAYGKTNIVFLDPQSGSTVSTAVDQDRKPIEFIKGLGKVDEIMSLGQWKFHKDGSKFVFILIGLRSGKLLIVSYVTTAPKEIPDWWTNMGVLRRPASYEHQTKNVISFEGPVYSCTGSDDGIFICSSNQLYWQALDSVEKKMKTIAVFDLPSPGLSIEVQGEFINIVTSRHSMVVVKFSLETKALSSHLTDQVSRNGLQQLTVPHFPLSLMSDRTLSVTGLWYKEHSHYLDATSKIFEAELTSSIVKFQTGTVRKKQNKFYKDDYEMFESHEDKSLSQGQGGKMLGISIDGSVSHFEVLPQKIWVLLRYIQNMAMHSPIICPFTYDRVQRDEYGNYQVEPLPTSSPKSARHVDGDILMRCKALGRKRFADLLMQALPDDDDEDDDGFENPKIRHKRFLELVGECLVPSAKADGWDAYWEAYKLMCWHLLPVI